uniref:Uncharacterized protein n=1 Tax=Glossina pallidipes TaxID=7398 RepID=A0A1A9ZS41_GLOPL
MKGQHLHRYVFNFIADPRVNPLKCTYFLTGTTSRSVANCNETVQDIKLKDFDNVVDDIKTRGDLDKVSTELELIYTEEVIGDRNWIAPDNREVIGADVLDAGSASVLGVAFSALFTLPDKREEPVGVEVAPLMLGAAVVAACPSLAEAAAILVLGAEVESGSKYIQAHLQHQKPFIFLIEKT